MSSELEAAAADSIASLVRRNHRHMPQPGQTCANCGAVLEGPYCHVCGQDSDTHKRSIRHLLVEAVEGMFELDGRLFRTLPALFLHPGRLARDYIEGRVARHVPPFRTFLVALLLFIFAAEHAAHEQTVAQERRTEAHTALLATPAGRASESARMRDEASKTLADNLKDAAIERADDLKDADNKPERIEAIYARAAARAQKHYSAALTRADRVAQGLPADDPKAASTDDAKSKSWWKKGLKKATENPDYYWSVLFNWGHRAAVLLLPIVGLSLALVYRKRRDIFLYDHLLVAMDILSFNFLSTAIGLVLPFAAMPFWFAFVAAWTPINLFQTLRGAYGSSIPGAILKTLVIWTTTSFSFLILLCGLMVLAVAQL